jgi:hypothetical protein
MGVERPGSASAAVGRVGDRKRDFMPESYARERARR